MSIPVERHDPLPISTPAGPAPRAVALLPGAVLAVSTASYIILFGWLSLRRYWGYQMHALDMGNMAQAAWNTVHGRPFFFTNMRLPWNIEAWGTTTRLSFHVEPIFPLVSLSYLIYPGPESLIVVQTVALALGAIPTYLLAVDVLGSRSLGLLFAVAYLLFPTVEAMNLFEFHAVALATPLLIAAYLSARRGSTFLFVLFSLMAMGTKEEIGLIVAGFGLYAWIVFGLRRTGAAVAVIGVVWSLFAVFVIERHFRSPGSVTYMRSRYGYLAGSGHGPGAVVRTVLTDPSSIARHIFTWPKAAYLRFLLVPVGLLSLAAPEVLLLGTPTLALNLLSAEFHMYTGVGDNSAELVSVVVIAAIVGAGRLLPLVALRIGASRARLLAGTVLTGSVLWTQLAFGYTPLGPNFEIAAIGRHQRIADRFVAMVPAGVPVATQDQLDPHLANRRYLYLFGDTGRQPLLAPANDVVLDVSAQSYAWPPSQIYARAQQLLRTGWGVVAAEDGLIYLRRGVANRRIPLSFYSYAMADAIRPSHHLRWAARGLLVTGFDARRTNLPNHRIPDIEFTVYFRPQRRLRANVVPRIEERVGGRTIGAGDPVGLDWFPTSRWRPGHTYKVSFQPIETTWQQPATARFRLTLDSAHAGCAGLASCPRALNDLGSLTVGW